MVRGSRSRLAFAWFLTHSLQLLLHAGTSCLQVGIAGGGCYVHDVFSYSILCVSSNAWRRRFLQCSIRHFSR